MSLLQQLPGALLRCGVRGVCVAWPPALCSGQPNWPTSDFTTLSICDVASKSAYALAWQSGVGWLILREISESESQTVRGPQTIGGGDCLGATIYTEQY